MLKILALVLVFVIFTIGTVTVRYNKFRSNEVNKPVTRNPILNHVPLDLNHEIKYMQKLNGYQFEDYTAWLLKWNGFIGIKQTGKNRDYGLDVLAYRHHIAYGFQCKHYKKRKIKRQVIKHTADGAHFYGTRRAVVITNARFSDPAVRSRKFFHVELWGGPVLVKLIQRAIFNYRHARHAKRNP